MAKHSQSMFYFPLFLFSIILKFNYFHSSIEETLSCLHLITTFIINITKDSFLLSTDQERLELDTIHHFLAHSYWAKHIPKSIVERSIKHSLCFGIYRGNQQPGFARIISDYVSFTPVTPPELWMGNQDILCRGITKNIIYE